MATAVPTNIDAAYARAQRDDALERLEEARKAASVSSSGGRSWSPQALSELLEQAQYWSRVLRALEAPTSKNTRVSTATWT